MGIAFVIRHVLSPDRERSGVCGYITGCAPKSHGIIFIYDFSNPRPPYFLAVLLKQKWGEKCKNISFSVCFSCVYFHMLPMRHPQPVCFVVCTRADIIKQPIVVARVTAVPCYAISVIRLMQVVIV